MNSNFSGTWKADLENSRFLSPLPKGVVIQIDHADNYLREEIIITKNDSLEERVVFTCDTTGNERSTTLNGKAIRGKSHWVGSELVIESWMQFGDQELYFRDCWSLTDEGQTLIMEHKDDALEGQLTALRKMEQETGRPSKSTRYGRPPFFPIHELWLRYPMLRGAALESLPNPARP